MSFDIECASCGEEGTKLNECPKSKRPCGHHCNHVWDQDACDWCGATVNDDGDLVVPEQTSDET